MKQYPSMTPVEDKYLGRKAHVFYKYDGSNLRVQWNAKRGWYKWGTRERLFDKTDKDFGPAIEVSERDFAEPLAKAIGDNFKKIQWAIAYLEYFGPHSFAGIHEPGWLGVESNDPKELVLFDVNIHQKGFLDPTQFLKHFDHLKIAQLLEERIITEEFIEQVRKGDYQHPVVEGVICKGGTGHKLWMCKIKTHEYLRKLQERFGTGYGQYWE